MSDPYKRDQRKGRWMVDGDLLKNYAHFETNKLIQADVLIFETKYHFQRNIMEFLGISEHFDVVPEGNLIPLYKPVLGYKLFPYSGISVLRWERC